MAKLEELTASNVMKGIIPDVLSTVVSAPRYGSTGLLPMNSDNLAMSSWRNPVE